MDSATGFLDFICASKSTRVRGAKSTGVPVYSASVLVKPIEIANDEVRAELRVEAPADTVFDYLSDLRNMVVWWPEHPVYRLLRGDGAAGSIYLWRYSVRGFPLVGYSRVLVRERHTRFEYRVGPPGVGARFSYRFTDEGDSTRIDVSCVTLFARLGGFAAQIVPEVTRAFERLADHAR